MCKQASENEKMAGIHRHTETRAHAHAWTKTATAKKDRKSDRDRGRKRERKDQKEGVEQAAERCGHETHGYTRRVIIRLMPTP